jgi:hypothetical protein
LLGKILKVDESFSDDLVMWIDDVDVAQRLDALEGILLNEDPDLVTSFRALAHPSLRGSSAPFIKRAATLKSSTPSSGPEDVPAWLSLAGFFGAFLVAVGLMTGSWAVLVSSVALVIGTLAVVGMLAVLARSFPTWGRRRSLSPRSLS